MKRFAACIVISLIVSACGVPKNLTTPDNKKSSIVGIAMKARLLNAFVKKQPTVFFVRLDPKDKNFIGSKILQSNYARGKYVYLINAEPGKYAAVASFKYENEFCYVTYFDTAMIEKTATNVGPGEIAYLGTYTVNSQLKNLYDNIEKNGDAAQKHYHGLLKSELSGTNYCGIVYKEDKSRNTTSEFLAKSKDYFKKTDWKDIVDKAVEKDRKK